MGAYEPKFLYGDTITGTASATITGGQLLCVSGNGTVGPAGTSTQAKVVGVAAFDAASTEQVSFFPRGKVHISTASGAITAGDQLAAGAAGTVATEAAASGNTAGDINNGREIIGVALTTATDTNPVEWMEF
jgi:hypothetical protein